MRDSGQWSVVERVAPFNPLLLITNHWSLVTERRTMECRLFNERDRELLAEYTGALGSRDFPAVLEKLEGQKAQLMDEGKEAAADAPRKEKKAVEAEYAQKVAAVEESIQTAKEALWLTEKFGEGEYHDIPGLCKVAALEEIEGKGYSLTPGAYVGVAPTEDDGVDFHQRMTEIHKELLSLQAESNRLMETISKNWEEMGL